ncbi:hypothetical protein MLD38_008239 [Melastoma candidum]|uniref:Uncharacterized protein n=1 Tax=Melastoma candidum TaxID=119954 RepID=A0ACB9RWR9_9MYRT|nr:hypothetical protein MLD38_008239 [Melastoma candidum]
MAEEQALGAKSNQGPYKKFSLDQQPPLNSSAAAAAIKATPVAAPISPILPPPSMTIPPAAMTVNRCTSCRKRVGLTGFHCRCGTTYCGVHRYPEKHGCRYDYKKEGREEIQRQNPVVVAEKLRKI